MQDRIEINGVWYVREILDEDINVTTTDFYGSVYENDKFVFEATKLISSDEIDIKVTDKRTKPWKTNDYDYQPFLRGIIDGDPQIRDTNIDLLGVFGHNCMKKFLMILREKNWVI